MTVIEWFSWNLEMTYEKNVSFFLPLTVTYWTRLSLICIDIVVETLTWAVKKICHTVKSFSKIEGFLKLSDLKMFRLTVSSLMFYLLTAALLMVFFPTQNQICILAYFLQQIKTFTLRILIIPWQHLHTLLWGTIKTISLNVNSNISDFSKWFLFSKHTVN